MAEHDERYNSAGRLRGKAYDTEMERLQEQLEQVLDRGGDFVPANVGQQGENEVRLLKASRGG